METHIALKAAKAEMAMRDLGLAGTIDGGSARRVAGWLVADFNWIGDMPTVEHAIQLEHSANMIISTKDGRIVITALVVQFAQRVAL